MPRISNSCVSENELEISTDLSGSGTIHVPMPYPNLGLVVASTESLISREKPYLLLKELARGSLGRITQRLFDWQMLGFRQPEPLLETLKKLSKRFSLCVVDDADSSKREREQEFLAILHELMELYLLETKAFTEQSLIWWMRNNEKLTVRFGIGTADLPLENLAALESYSPFLEQGFHTVLPMPAWRELEPEQGQFQWERLEQRLVNVHRLGKKIILGPLLSFDRELLPQWLLDNINEDGFFETGITRLVNSLSERYGSLADGWILANRFLAQTLPKISQSRLMGMIRILAQQLRSRGIETPILAGIEQPWGEYALHHNTEWEQTQIAETLMGSREIDGFLLDINLGAGEHFTLPHAPVIISNKIDQWSYLGKKIYIMFSVPSSGSMLAEGETLPQWSPETQKFWTDILLNMMFGKRMIQGIFWQQLQDVPGENRGLITAEGRAKAVFEPFAYYRRTILQ